MCVVLQWLVVVGCHGDFLAAKEIAVFLSLPLRHLRSNTSIGMDFDSQSFNAAEIGVKLRSYEDLYPTRFLGSLGTFTCTDVGCKL